MSADPTAVIASLGLEPMYSAQEAAEMLGRSFSWLDQRLRAGQFRPAGWHHGATVADSRGYRRFTLPMLRDIIEASAHHGWFSVEDIRFGLTAVISASYRETGEYKITG